MTVDALRTATPLVDAVRARPRRADLPDLGAHLRLQPGVRALPVQLGPARPARADHRASAGGHRRAASGCRSSTSTSAAASRPSARTSGSCVDYATAHHVGVKFSTNGVADRRRAWPRRLAGDRLRRRADLARRRDRRGQRRGPRRRARTTRRSGAWSTSPTPASRGFKISVVCTRQNVGQLDEFKAHRRPLRRAAAAHPAAPVGPRRRRLGRAAPDRRRSSASSTTGCSRTARRC